ncbi:MAG: HAMP domain-containing histidine kinase, partial [Chloroflexi bacterium]
MGVADYLVKGKFDTDLLARVIHYSLQRKQMEQQRIQELIEINESKDEFISLASHQLRTPATAVKQYVGMILQGFAGDIPPQQEAFLKHAYSSNDRQLRIIDDIMRVARLDMNRITLANEEFDLRDTVQNAVDDVKPEIEDKQQTIDVSMPTEPLPILADDSYLGMAISNLIDNASKYTDKGKPIFVSAAARKSSYVLSVRDEGVGIKESDMKKLFIKFSRISNPLSIAANGTGLGLYWAKEIVELHGGTIAAESIINSGTTFTITLPIKHSSTS